MANSKSSVALAALVAAAFSLPAHAHGGGGGHSGGHAHSHSGGSMPHRFFSGRPRIGFFLGAPVYAATYYYPAPLAPMPPIEYIEKPPDGTLYFCPDANGYYPAVPQCPGGWVQAQAQWAWPPPAPAPDTSFDGAWSPLAPRY